jgi:nucleolar protein 56
MVVKRLDFLEKAKASVKEAYERKDLALIQAVRTLDDLDECTNLMYTRLDEWLKINFPELDLGQKQFVAFASEFGSREEIDATKALELFGEDEGTRVLQLAEKSYGATFDLRDKNAVRELALSIKTLMEARVKTEDYVSQEAHQLMKNASYLVEPLLAARLLTIAGSLEKLAKMPASTIQVLGAEKALFKHLARGSKPPKHGIIFQSSFIRNAGRDKRGKISRDLSTKLAIAFRADFFTKRFIGDKLKQDFEKRLKEIG